MTGRLGPSLRRFPRVNQPEHTQQLGGMKAAAQRVAAHAQSTPEPLILKGSMKPTFDEDKSWAVLRTRRANG